MPDRTRPRPRRQRRVPPVVLAAVVAFGALSALWSVAVPLLEAPDESDHLGLVLHLADGNPYPSYDGLQSPKAILTMCPDRASSTRVCPDPGQAVTATSTRLHLLADAPDKGARPAWNDGDGTMRVGRLNQMPQHPPLYYQAMATVLRAERALAGGPPSLDQELALLRLVNALLVAPLPLLAWWAARRLGLDHPTAVAASLAPFGLPMLTHIGSTLNNDNLLTVCGAALVALLAGVVRGDRSARTAAAAGLVTGLALLTKASAVVFPPLVVLAYLVGSRSPAWPAQDGTEPAPDGSPPAGGAGRWRRPLPGVVASVGVVGLVTVVLAGWWYVGQFVRTGSFTPTIESTRFDASLQPPGFVPSWSAFLEQFAPNLNTRFWGSFGWYSVRWSQALSLTLTVAVVALVVSAVATRRVPGTRDGAEVRRSAVWVLVAPLVALGLFVLIRAHDLYATTSRFIFIQGRYLFAGVAGLAVVVAIGLRRVAGRWTPVAMAVAVSLLQFQGLRRVLAGYWGGPGLGPRGQLRALVAYSGWPGEVLGVLGVVVVAAAGWLAWGLAGTVRDGRPGPGGGPGSPVGSIAP